MKQNKLRQMLQVFLIFLCYKSTKLHACTEIFILNKFESDRDGAIGKAFALHVGVQIKTKTDVSVYKI